jgi:glucuronate isomerase
LPTFRPDNGINIEKPGFASWVKKLSPPSPERRLKTTGTLKKAMAGRMEYFNSRGCILSDHAMDPVVFMECGEQEAAEIFEKALAGKKLTPDEVVKYKTDMMVFLGQYSRLGWTMQLHIGCIRDTNSSYYRLLGPNTGFDAINDRSFAQSLARLLDSINEAGGIPENHYLLPESQR